MEEEELRKIARDQQVVRVAARGISMVMAHRLSEEQLSRLIELDEQYLESVRQVCPEMTEGID